MQPARLAAVLERPLEDYAQTQLARAHASFFTFVTQRLPLAVAGNTRSREQVWRQSYPDWVENHARSITNDDARALFKRWWFAQAVVTISTAMDGAHFLRLTMAEMLHHYNALFNHFHAQAALPPVSTPTASVATALDAAR